MASQSFKLPASPSMPLFPLSPERVNSARSPFGIPHSPSAPDFARSKHTRTNSDVQGMVARFNSLDIKDHAELREKEKAALKRAQMGREEAESEMRKSREEARSLRKDVEEGKECERKITKRLDVVTEELRRAKETQNVAQGLYEKEIRRARKEAFKSSSALVKLQEELKATRNLLQVLRSDLELERLKVGKREQDTFTAQYQLVGMQAELDKAHTKLKVVEEERDALKTNLKEEEVARIAAEGRIALPPSKSEDDEFASPQKRRPEPKLFAKDHPPNKNRAEIENLQEELEKHRRRWQTAEDQIEFMKMECQFQCCSCRIAEQQGSTFVHDNAFEEELQQMKAVIDDAVAASTSADIQQADSILPVERVPSLSIHADQLSHKVSSPVPKQGTDFELSPSPGIFRTKTPVSHRQRPQQGVAVASIDETMGETAHPQEQDSSQTHIQAPVTPAHREVRTVTTTTTVPLAGQSDTDYSAFFSPNGMTREEAMARIRERRGRARSVAGTPKKTPNDKSLPRRDISAPEMRNDKTPKSAPRGRLAAR